MLLKYIVLKVFGNNNIHVQHVGYLSITALFNISRGCRYESNAFFTAEHGGTHLDAPAHFFEGAMRTHEIPMNKLVGPGVVINVKVELTR